MVHYGLSVEYLSSSLLLINMCNDVANFCFKHKLINGKICKSLVLSMMWTQLLCRLTGEKCQIGRDVYGQRGPIAEMMPFLDHISKKQERVFFFFFLVHKQV